MHAMAQVVGNREITAQESAFDGFGYPLIEYSCGAEYYQIRPPHETTWNMMNRTEIEKRARNNNSTTRSTTRELKDIAYAPAVVKYVNRKNDDNSLTNHDL